MKICPKCKKERQSKKFCTQCREKLVEGILCEIVDDEGSKCGEILQLGDKFCGECGSEVNKLNFENPQKSTQSGKAPSEESSGHDGNSKDEDVQPTETIFADNENQPEVQRETEIVQSDDEDDWREADEGVASDTSHGDKQPKPKQNESDTSGCSDTKNTTPKLLNGFIESLYEDRYAIYENVFVWSVTAKPPEEFVEILRSGRGH